MTSPSPSSDAAVSLAIELLRSGREVTLTNLSGSLWPMVRVGEALTLVPLSHTPEVGALLAVERRGRIVVHRLVATQGERLLLKGDANAHTDEPVTRDDVLGTVSRQRLRLGPTLDHARAPLRLVNRVMAEVSLRTELPWRAGRALHRWISG
jgi:hypothetical protein